MSEVAREQGEVRFRIGAAIKRTFVVFFRNIVPFGLLALVFNAPTQFLAIKYTTPEVFSGDINWPVVIVAVIATILLGYLLSATLVYGTVMDLRGGRASIVECIVRGLGLLLPVIGVGILVTLIIAFFTCLLIIPGIIALIMLWVAVPVAVVERPGIWASVTRSRELTKGYRWHLFGLILILVILSSVIGGVINGAVGFGVGFFPGSEISSTVALVIHAIVQAFSSALLAVAGAVAYHDLRIAKEGASAEQIAAVFD